MKGQSLSYECLKLLYTNRNCSETAIKYAPTTSFSSLNFLKSWINDKRINSTRDHFFDGSRSRIYCYGITSLNSLNCLFEARTHVATQPSEIYYNSRLLTDGIRYPKSTEGGCFKSYSSSKDVLIFVEPSKIIRKIVIYSIIDKSGKLFNLFL